MSATCEKCGFVAYGHNDVYEASVCGVTHPTEKKARAANGNGEKTTTRAPRARKTTAKK